ncbi:MAG: endonuclease/exonuclease/phosphatase family protein [Phycisphaerales bacterium]|nr:endonuclease/exonuclease/phosphatase family protein [Phycisphaerales bacterium]
MQDDRQVKGKSKARTIHKCIAPSIVISAVLASNAGLLADVFPQLDLLVHFQVQYAWVLAACLLYLLIQGRFGWAILATAALSLPMMRIAPWYFPSPTLSYLETHEEQTELELLSCNVKYTNKNYQDLIKLIKETDADVVVVQEATHAWELALDQLSNMYPHRIAHPASGPRGMIMLSKLPFLQSKVEVHPITRHCTLAGWIRFDNQDILLIASHPFRPGLRHGPTLIASELEMAASFANKDTQNVIFIGDLNTTMWSSTYTRFVQKHRLSNLRKGFGICASWSRVIPWVSAIPIDHCLIGDNFHGVSFDLLPVAGSDHDAINALVRLRQ